MNQIAILEDAISDEDCSFAISLFKQFEEENKFKEVKDKRWLYSYPVEPRLTPLIDKYLQKINQEYQKEFYIREVLLSIYNTGSYLGPHIDHTDEELKNSMGVLMYFNDDFEGGEIFFPNLNGEYKPKKGSIFLFPCNQLPYKHGVKTIISGTRYTMPLEITENFNLKCEY